MSRILFIQYLTWHFFDVPKEILRAWKNFLYFNFNYFSVPDLLKTYFSYWRGYYYPYEKKWDLMRWLEAFVFNNIMSRTVGVMFRTVFIVIGVALEISIFLGGIIIFIGWFLLPFLLLIAFLLGVRLVF